MNAPQWIVAVILGLGFIVALFRGDAVRENQRYSFVSSALEILVWLGLLGWGGFWK